MKLPWNLGLTTLVPRCVLMFSMGIHRMWIFMWLSQLFIAYGRAVTWCFCTCPVATAIFCVWISQSSAPALPTIELFLPVCPVQTSHSFFSFSPYCSTLYRAGHPLALAHEFSSLNIHPSHLHPQPTMEQKGEVFQHFLAWKVSLRRSMTLFLLCE